MNSRLDIPTDSSVTPLEMSALPLQLKAAVTVVLVVGAIAAAAAVDNEC